MTQSRMICLLWLCATMLVSGCTRTRTRMAIHDQSPMNEGRAFVESDDAPAGSRPAARDSVVEGAVDLRREIQLINAEQPGVVDVSGSMNSTGTSIKTSATMAVEPLQLDSVIASVVASYPLLQSAMFGRNIAQGDLLAANGEFDLKLKADTLNMPVGFYENYRQSVSAEQPLYGGGSVFGGHRIGTGDFPVYYGERATNLGGEFKVGAVIPLAQNRAIDDRRAGVWRGDWEVQSVEPEIQAQYIEFIRAASITYWNWVAAGQNVRITEELLQNATERNEGLRRRVEEGDAPAIELTDNQRLIVSRRTKLIDARRKLQQSAYKLSLFLRDEFGQPRVIDELHLPREFPQADDPSRQDLDTDIQTAVANRPELRALAILREQLNIDYSVARNLCLPQIDAVVVGSQDVGNPYDPKKDDKSPLEFEVGLMASIPLQRRKAQGKSVAVEGKLAQVRIKSQFTREKIVAEVQSASAALNAAYQQLEQAHQALDLARKMEVAERRKFDLGDSNLLLVNLREQATADAAATEVDARLNFFDAQADYRAALATDIAP